MTVPERLPSEHGFATSTELATLFTETQAFLESYCPPDQKYDPENGYYRSLEISMKTLRVWAPQHVMALSARKSMNFTLWPVRPTIGLEIFWTWYHRGISPHLNTTVAINPAVNEPEGWEQYRDHDPNHYWEGAVQPQSGQAKWWVNNFFEGMELDNLLGTERLLRYEATALTGIVRALAGREPEEIYAAQYIDPEMNGDDLCE